jgi:hypothetical protein
LHVLLPQQGWPAAPHAAQFPVTHVSFDAVHTPPGLQHACVAPPHVPQLPFAHVPPNVGHVEPEA